MKRTAIIVAVIAVILMGIFAFGGKANAPTLPDGQTDGNPAPVATSTATTTNSGAPATSTPGTPATPGTASPKTVTLKLDEAQVVNGLSINAWAVLEDSRCPTDVQCTWAGRARVAFNVTGTGTYVNQNASIELEPGQAKAALGKQITLNSVTPNPISTKKIQDSEYWFSVTVK